MTEDKKIYSETQYEWFTKLTNRPKDEIFQTQDKDCIYSKGYSGGINFEFYPNQKQLNILYPFPTFKELTDLGIEFYTEHAYGPGWQDICHDLEKPEYYGYDIGELKVNEKLHETSLEYFINELKTIDGLMSYMCSYFSHKEIFTELSEEKTKKLNKLFSQFVKVNSLSHLNEYYDAEDFNGIIYCKWKVEKKINNDGYLDIEVSIQLPDYHNEICKILCTKDYEYAIANLFGHCNCIDGRMDDLSTYGVYCNLNFEKDYLEPNQFDENNDDIQFPWNRNS